MEGYDDVPGGGCTAKRIKLDLESANTGDVGVPGAFCTLFTSPKPSMDTTEGGSSTPGDCDSGCEVPPADTSISDAGETPPGHRAVSEEDSLDVDGEGNGLPSIAWIRQQMENGVDPRRLLGEMGVDTDRLPGDVDDALLWELIIGELCEPPRRSKLRHVNTIDDVVRLLRGARRVIVLTGAGVSVSCGIPDFRSRDGVYARLAQDFPGLPSPQAMFDIGYFRRDPRPFYRFARELYPGKFRPSPSHRFIRLLERRGRLLRNYTQNIDTLERVAGIERLVECHGSFATASCTSPNCSQKVVADAVREAVLEQRIPLCPRCHPEGPASVPPDHPEPRELVSSGIMKPDIVFFGEGLPEAFDRAINSDSAECDLLLVIGSSLKVRPVALIPGALPPNVPQVLINREPLPHCCFDVELLGDCDVIVNYLCQMLGDQWEEGVHSDQVLVQTSNLLPLVDAEDDEASMERPCDCHSGCLSCGKREELSETTGAGKERHMSIDSARDSGIGENSNLESRLEEESSSQPEPDPVDRNVPEPENENETNNDEETQERHTETDMRGYWQPKVKRSLAERLPSSTYYHIPPNRYVFPGAEIFYDPDKNFLYEAGSTTDSSPASSEAESETEDSDIPQTAPE